MTAFDLKLVTKTLEKVATRARNSEAKSSDMNITSPIPLKHFPFVRSFYPRPLISNMAPLKRKGSKSLANKDVVGVAADNPFIYSPFLGPKKTVKRNEVLWVEDDPAEIALSIVNPLPFELRVENMVKSSSNIITWCYVLSLVWNSILSSLDIGFLNYRPC